jgi:hypothetical protein
VSDCLKKNFDGSEKNLVFNKLFQLAILESSFDVVLLGLDQNRPKLMNIKEMLKMLCRASPHDIPSAQAEAHALSLKDMKNITALPRHKSNGRGQSQRTV